MQSSGDGINLEDCVVYLQHMQSKYPGGVPEEYIVEPVQGDIPATEEESKGEVQFGTGSGSAIGAFLGAESVDDSQFHSAAWPFAQESRELLNAAIESGMKRQVESIYLMNAYNGRAHLDVRNSSGLSSQRVSCESGNADQLSSLMNELQSTAARLVVVLGEEAYELLKSQGLQAGASFAEARGSWFPCLEQLCLVTHSPRAVIASKQKKREFWQDLQEFMRRSEG